MRRVPSCAIINTPAKSARKDREGERCSPLPQYRQLVHRTPEGEEGEEEEEARREIFFAATLLAGAAILGRTREIESSIFARERGAAGAHAYIATCTHTRARARACHYPGRLPLHYSVTICTLLGEKFLQTTRRPERADLQAKTGENETQRGGGGTEPDEEPAEPLPEREKVKRGRQREARVAAHDAEHRDC